MDVAIVPEYSNLLDNNFVTWDGEYAEDRSYDVDRGGYTELKNVFEQNGHTLNTIDLVNINKIDACIFVDSDMNWIKQVLECDNDPDMIYIMREPPCYRSFNSTSNLSRWSTVFDHILTWNDNLSQNYVNFSSYNWPQYLPQNIEEGYSFDDCKLLVNISSRKHSSHPDELYSAREDIIEFFSETHPEEFELYGKWWTSPPRIIDDILLEKIFLPNKYPNIYEGSIPISEKTDLYQKFKFALCFENQTEIDGWITEKIFDCYRARIVPIYWGANNVSEYLPSESYIDYRNFIGPSDLYNYISSMDEEEYSEYIVAGQNFLRDRPEDFSSDKFAEDVYSAVTSIDNSCSKWVPADIQSYIDYMGEADALVNNYDEIGRLEYISRFGKIIANRPSTVINHPVSYFACKSLVPFLPDIRIGSGWR